MVYYKNLQNRKSWPHLSSYCQHRYPARNIGRVKNDAKQNSWCKILVQKHNRSSALRHHVCSNIQSTPAGKLDVTIQGHCWPVLAAVIRRFPLLAGCCDRPVPSVTAPPGPGSEPSRLFELAGLPGAPPGPAPTRPLSLPLPPRSDPSPALVNRSSGMDGNFPNVTERGSDQLKGRRRHPPAALMDQVYCGGMLQLPRVHTELAKRSFQYRATAAWKRCTQS